MGEFFKLQDLALIVPEIELAAFGLVLLIADLIIRDKRMLGYMSLVGLTIAAIFLFRLSGVNAVAYGGQLVVDPFSAYFKFIFLIAAGLTVALSMRYLEIEREHHGEYYALILFATMGMMFMAGGICCNGMPTRRLVHFGEMVGARMGV